MRKIFQETKITRFNLNSDFGRNNVYKNENVIQIEYLGNEYAVAEIATNLENLTLIDYTLQTKKYEQIIEDLHKKMDSQREEIFELEEKILDLETESGFLK